MSLVTYLCVTQLFSSVNRKEIILVLCVLIKNTKSYTESCLNRQNKTECKCRAHILLEAPSWQQLSDWFVFVLFVALKKRIPLKICTLSCFVCEKSVLCWNLLCVFDFFFRTQAVNSFRFFSPLHVDHIHIYQIFFPSENPVSEIMYI